MNLASDHKVAPIGYLGTKEMTERCLSIILEQSACIEDSYSAIMTGNTVTGQSCSVRHATTKPL